MTEGSRRADARRRGRVLARRPGRSAGSRRTPRFDDDIRRRFLDAARSRRRRQAHRLGSERRRARSRCSSCSTSFRATCSAGKPAPSPPTRWRARSPSRAIVRGFDGACPDAARLFLSAVRAFGRSRRPGTRRRVLSRARRRRRPEMGANCTPTSSAASAASRTATRCSAASPRRRNRRSSMAAALPASAKSRDAAQFLC